MKGKILKECIENSSLTVVQVAKKFNISRQAVYDLYEKDDIGKEYSRIAEEIGLTKYDTSLQKKDLGISAKEALEMADSMADKVREDYKERIVELNAHISMLTGLLKKNKIIA